MKASARPLLDNPVDAELFVGRGSELSAIWAALNAELNVLVTGDRGSGKTSLLRHLQLDSRSPFTVARREGDFPMTYVRVEGIADGRALLARIVEAVTGAPAAESDGPDALLRILTTYRQHFVDDTHTRWQEQSEDGTEPTGTRLFPVIIVDDVTAAAGHALFGQYRDEVWSTGYLWVVSVRENDRAGLLTPPADAFFEKVVELAPLSTDEMLDLLNRRGGVDLTQIGHTLADAVGGNPRALVGALRSLMQDPESYDANAQAIGARDDAIHALGRSASMLAAELKARGAVSASDDDLLAALGWSRPRAVQVFKQLDDKGLVRSSEVSSGQGRPRRVYELTPPAEWMRLRGTDPETAT
ncbi:AAA family ATPase [Rhodococcoides fascians]|uniref:AAA family ATPase n=1 Tax=Rhodococcoides fascians TaxID=1828 RepID=UPI003672EEB4